MLSLRDKHRGTLFWDIQDGGFTQYKGLWVMCMNECKHDHSYVENL